MLDKFGLKLLNVLLDAGKNGDYIVISLEDIKSYFKSNEINDTILNNTLNFLSQNDYIKIKFKDDEQICYSCLTKARLIDDTNLINKNNKKQLNKLIILNILFSCLSAFFGAILAIFIVHFFL